MADNKKPILHLSPANGFPASTYQQLLNELSNCCKVNYMDIVGHDPNYPVEKNWNNLTQELIHFIEGNYDEPIYAIGHSLGGGLCYKAAALRPELFKAIILLDTPIFSFRAAVIIKLLKLFGFAKYITPAKRTLNRKQQWKNKATVKKHFQNKKPYQYFSPECLNDFVEHGTKECHGYRKLRFDPEIEYNIYLHIPDNFYTVKNQTKTPMYLFYGQEKTLIPKSIIKHMKKKLGIHVESFPGGHMFPFEQPELLAEKIQQIMIDLEKPSVKK